MQGVFQTENRSRLPSDVLNLEQIIRADDHPPGGGESIGSEVCYRAGICDQWIEIVGKLCEVAGTIEIRIGIRMVVVGIQVAGPAR